ncbi:MAG: aminoglycoside phosphotransferase family protein [Actinomycetota bacterium]|nr:aminoglycoside phosphotransferase family protein [Actinomycetota bacterium]
MCRRVLGNAVEVRSATELGWGSYNSTFRVELVHGPALVLRVAPQAGSQLRSERHWMRSEYAAAPWLVGLGSLVPRVVGADFTHQVIDRDYLVQTLLVGTPAPELMSGYSRSLWPGLFAQLGEISRRIHEVPGETWGPVSAPVHGSWSGAVLTSLAERAADLMSMSAPSQDVKDFALIVEASRSQLDQIARPALLHGDLWTANVLLEPTASRPTVIGVLDSERAWWGDPLADWALYRANARAVEAERDAFWAAYGPLPLDGEACWRLRVYQGWHLAAERVEAARHHHHDTVERTLRDLGDVIQALR